MTITKEVISVIRLSFHLHHVHEYCNQHSLYYNDQKPVSEKIRSYHESGYLENLIDIHFDEEKCFNQGINQQRFSLTVFHHSGLFALLSIAIVCCILLVLVEHLVFKYFLPVCRRRPDDSFWKSLNVMFFSQVRLPSKFGSKTNT